MSTITMHRGDSFNIVFTLKDAATGLPLNLTGSTFILTVDRKQNPVDSNTRLFTVNGSLDGTPSNGRVTFKPLTTHTATAGNYYYDVQMTTAATSQVRTVVKDQFIITQDITK